MTRANKKTPAQVKVALELFDTDEVEPAPASPLRSLASAASMPAPPSPYKLQRLEAKQSARVSGAELDYAKVLLQHSEEKGDLEYKIISLRIDEIFRRSKRKIGGAEKRLQTAELWSLELDHTLLLLDTLSAHEICLIAERAHTLRLLEVRDQEISRLERVVRRYRRPQQ